MSRRQTELVVGLATDLRQVVPEEPVWRQTIEEYAAHHETLILSAVSSGYPQRGTIWTYPGCLLFATSLLTTLGMYYILHYFWSLLCILSTFYFCLVTLILKSKCIVIYFNTKAECKFVLKFLLNQVVSNLDRFI